MSIENPAVPLTDLDDGDPTFEALTGGDTGTAAGVRVTRRRALGLSAVWRGVNLIAGDVGRHAFRVYRKVGAGLEADPQHQAARVMRRPNEYMTPFTFRQTLQAHALLSGNGYAYIFRSAVDAKPLELLPLNPDRTWPVRADGELWYVTSLMPTEKIPGKSKQRYQLVRIPACDMLHVKGLGFDGLVGYPVMRIMRDTLSTAVAARDYGARFFANDGTPGVTLEVPAGMKEAAVNNLRASWTDLHVGIKNKFRVAILRDGVKLNTLSAATARDAQLLENRDFDARELANVLGVPPHKVGDPSRTAYNSLESENQSYMEDTLDRWFVAWEQECDAKLLTEAEKELETHACRFDSRQLARVPLTERASYYATALTNGWHNIDEVRGFENLNPLPDGQGQKYRAPLNTAPVSNPQNPPAGAPPAAPPAPEKPADQPADPAAEEKPTPDPMAPARMLAADAVARCVRRLTIDASKRTTPKALSEYLGGKLWDETGTLADMLATTARCAVLAGHPPMTGLDLARSVCHEVRTALLPLTTRAAFSVPDIANTVDAAGIDLKAADSLFPARS